MLYRIQWRELGGKEFEEGSDFHVVKIHGIEPQIMACSELSVSLN